MPKLTSSMRFPPANTPTVKKSLRSRELLAPAENPASVKLRPGLNAVVTGVTVIPTPAALAPPPAVIVSENPKNTLSSIWHPLAAVVKVRYVAIGAEAHKAANPAVHITQVNAATVIIFFINLYFLLSPVLTVPRKLGTAWYRQFSDQTS